MIAADYQITETAQQTSLVAAFIFAVAMCAGIYVLATACRDRWSIEDAEADIDDLCGDYYADRDQHSTVPMLGRWS